MLKDLIEPQDRYPIALRDVAKRYGVVQAVKGVSLGVRAGEIHGLCGHNGAGKSTVVKMLSGLVAPDQGSVVIDGEPESFRGVADAQRRGIALVDQELSVIPALSVEENLTLGRPGEATIRNRRGDRRWARRVLADVGLERLDPRTVVAQLPLGERQLIEIARALGRDAKTIILDEPTATLSSTEIDRVFSSLRRMAGLGHAIVFVSHRLSELLSLCDRISVMRDGLLVASGEADEFTADELVRTMLGHMPEPAKAATPLSESLPPRLEIVGVSLGNSSSKLDLQVGPGEICGLAGQVGSGASELLRALAGLSPAASGEVTLDGRKHPLGSPRTAARRGLIFVSNDRKGEGLFMGHPVSANLTATRLKYLSAGGVLKRGAAGAEGRRLASLVGVEESKLPRPVRQLSGGNQQKVLIGRCLERRDLKVLLLDEPTRGVDVGGRAEIHSLIRQAADAGAAVVFCSTELDEILDLADSVVTMRSGKVVARRPRDEASHAGVLAEMTHRAAA